MINKVLIVGALGVVGLAAFRHFDALEDWEAVGLSRRSPDFPVRGRWLNINLAGEPPDEGAFAAAAGVTHLVYTALFEKASLRAGWTEREQIDTNVRMLRNAVDGLSAVSSELRHVTLLQGTKAYGVHHGQMRIPARESDPRFIASNFYYEQEDWLRETAARRGFAVTILRPQAVCGFALGNPMNVVTAVGVYAAICRELGMPMRYPGSLLCVKQATEAGLLAKAIYWAATTPRCAGETYNITNGDCFVWENVWGRVAGHFGIQAGPNHPFSLAAVMPDKGDVWERIVRRHGLLPYHYEEVCRSWQFLDYAVRQGEALPRHSLVSDIKSRRHGFLEFYDTEEMFLDLIRAMQEARVLPT